MGRGAESKIYLTGGGRVCLKCPHCSRHFNSENIYMLHQQKTHKIENPKPPQVLHLLNLFGNEFGKQFGNEFGKQSYTLSEKTFLRTKNGAK